MIYHIDRIIRETNEDFNDGAKIIYANTSKQDETALGKLMSDMREPNPDKMNYEVLKQKSKEAKSEYIVKEEKKMGKRLNNSIKKQRKKDWKKDLKKAKKKASKTRYSR